MAPLLYDSMFKLYFIQRKEFAVCAYIFVIRTYDLVGVDKLLQSVCTPSWHSGNCENWSKKLFWNA